ncbi:MAG: hypothetical protein WBF53_07060 [Litorimonas sp.]
MSFGVHNLTLCALLRIDVPGYPIRLSEGGEVDYAGERYTPADPVFGNITAFEDLASGEADEAPAFEVTWGIRDIAAAVALSQPTIQRSFADWRIIGLDTDTGAQVAEQRLFTGYVDRTELSGDDRRLELVMGFATDVDRLLNTDKGNRLNRAFHRSVWPGETGLDFMTGTTNQVGWGDETRRGGFGGGGFGGGGGGGFLAGVSRF